MRVYQCEDSLEGIFTAVYNAYEDRSDINDTLISITQELYLFAEYIPVETDQRKALKVINTLRRRFGEGDYMSICMALASSDAEKAQCVYRTIVLGLDKNTLPGHLLDNLADNSVNRVFSLARGANNEYLHLRGFTRFAELEQGILYSKIGPKNNVLTFLMPHFADRFPMENFILYDEKRELFGIHPAGKEWFLVKESGEEFQEENLKYSEREQEYQQLFRYFCKKIAIESRENTDLQQNMLPLRFREYMAEFNE